MLLLLLLYSIYPRLLPTMSDGQRKQERDYTPEVTALVQEVDGLVKVRWRRIGACGGDLELTTRVTGRRTAMSRRRSTRLACWRSRRGM